MALHNPSNPYVQQAAFQEHSMIYNPYGTMEPAHETRPGMQSTQKMRSGKVPELHAPSAGYKAGVDDSDGPLPPDATDRVPTDAVPVQREAEAQSSTLMRHDSDHAPASPVERIKHEEDLFRETIPALWGSEQDQAFHRRHSREHSDLSQLCQSSEAEAAENRRETNSSKGRNEDTRCVQTADGCTVCDTKSTVDPPLKRSYRPNHDCGRNPEHTRPYEGSVNDSGSTVKVNRGAW